MSIKRSYLAVVLLFFILIPAFSQSERSFAIKLYNEGMFEESARLLEQALAEAKAEPFDQALLGLCYLRLDRLEEAEAILEQVRRRDPDLSIVNLGLGQLRFEQRRFEEAYRAFSRAAELDPGSRDAKEGMAASLINQGAKHFSEGEEQSAEQKFLDALELNPDSVPALKNLGILELERGNPDRAAVYLERARPLAPTDAQLQILLVRVREEQGDRDGLMRELQRLVNLQPRNPDAWAKLGVLYEQHGNDAQAEQAFAQAEQWGSSEPYPYYWLARQKRSVSLAHLAVGKAVQKAGLLRFQAAQTIEDKGSELEEQDLLKLKELSVKINEPLQILEDTLVLLQELRDSPAAFREDLLLLNDWYPHSVELKEALAEFYQNQDAWAEALTIWERVLRTHPSSVKAQTGRAAALEMLDRPEEALLAYRRALDLDPRGAQHYEDLFRLCRKLGREEELLSLLREQSLRDTRNPVLFGKLAELEDRLGFPDQAAAHRHRQGELEAAAQ